MQFVVIIPARYHATRLPGKPLADIAGKPMICRVLAAAQASSATRVLVATDHPAIAAAVQAAGGEVSFTQSDHGSGSERVAETVEQLGLPDDAVVVNLQGDEPLVPPLLIDQVAAQLVRSGRSMATLATPIKQREELYNPHTVHVVVDINGDAIYFSRAPIPWPREPAALEWQLAQGYTLEAIAAHNSPAISACSYQRHLGLYSYRAGFIRRYVAWAASPLERIEQLEQLRALWYGEKISVATALLPAPGGVDTPEDLQAMRKLWQELSTPLPQEGSPSA